MDRTADLDSALSFVIGRIAEQAKVSGEPLSDEQRLLLNYLPSETPANWDPEFPVLVPRNINLERICALGKAAYPPGPSSKSIIARLGVCICCLDAQPAPYVGSSTMGRHETPQAAIGRPSTYCHWFGAHSGRGPACLERRWTLVPVSSNRFGMRC